MKLTKEQIATLEDVFSNYPDSYKKGIKDGDKYTTMAGIQNQIENLVSETDPIVYINNVKIIDTEGSVVTNFTFTLEKMFPGDSLP